MGASAGRFSAMVPVSGAAKTATYTREYAKQERDLTLLSDGERLTDAYAWARGGRVAPAGHARDPRRVPLDVLTDTIQRPDVSEIYVAALKGSRRIAAASKELRRETAMSS